MKPINSIMSNINIFSIFVFKSYKCIIVVFCLISFCIVARNMAYGTTLIVIRNVDGIFIGADSKARNRREPQCKITQVNDLFFGFTNFVEIVHPITGKKIFDANELATKVGAIKGTIRDKVDSFDKLVEVKLTEVLKIWSRTFSKDEIREIMFGTNVLMRVVIIGIENSKPIVLERVYSIDNFDVNPLRIKTDKFLDNGNFAISLGTDNAIFRDMRLCCNYLKCEFVILNEVKNLTKSMRYKTEILRLGPQNDNCDTASYRTE